jgi:hypothetical protein
MKIVRVICDVCKKIMREEIYESIEDNYDVDEQGNLRNIRQFFSRHGACQKEVRTLIDDFLKDRQAKLAATRPP